LLYDANLRVALLHRMPGAGPLFSEGAHQHASETLHDSVRPIGGVQRRSSSLGCVFVSEQQLLFARTLTHTASDKAPSNVLVASIVHGQLPLPLCQAAGFSTVEFHQRMH